MSQEQQQPEKTIVETAQTPIEPEQAQPDNVTSVYVSEATSSATAESADKDNSDNKDYRQGAVRRPHISSDASEAKRQRLEQKTTDMWVCFISTLITKDIKY